jgi:cytoskeletal protein CcmA (bactofilin family)
MKRKKKKLQHLDTIIGPETIITGNIKIKTSLRVDGKVYGEVECEGDVTIGEEGYVETSVKARNIIIAGKVTGKVHATEKLHILSTGSFSGSTILNSIVIDEGGIFQGESTMTQEEESTSKEGKIEKSKKDKKTNTVEKIAN